MGSSSVRSRPSSPTSRVWRRRRGSCAKTFRAPNCAASARPRRRCGWAPSRRDRGRRSARARRGGAGARRVAAAAAARLYGGEILREGIQDEENNVTRFVWVAPEGTEPGPAAEGAAWKTSLIFSELGEDHPGALVAALNEFSSRGINLSRIESRPLRSQLGRYMFFADVDG